MIAKETLKISSFLRASSEKKVSTMAAYWKPTLIQLK